jgi:hypothetical protein
MLGIASLICIIVAATIFGLAVFFVPARINMIAAGLFVGVVGMLLERLP